MIDVLIVINSGSSSLKFSIYPMADYDFIPLIKGKVAGIGRKPVLTAFGNNGTIDATGTLKEIPRNADHEWIITKLLDWLQSRFNELNLVAAGHRVVHGGQKFEGPTIINDTKRKILEKLVPLAPLHQPHNLTAIDIFAKVTPKIPQVACFDTSFHQTQPRLSQLFGLPYALTDAGIIRYGFHGLSYQ